MGKISARTEGEFRTSVRAGNHVMISDEPVAGGGADAGPTPYDLLAAGLASCTGMTLRFYANRERYPLRAVDVVVEHGRKHAADCAHCLSKTGYVHHFDVTLHLEGDLTDEQRAKLLDVAGRCPVAKTLGNEIRISHRLVEQSLPPTV